MSAPTKLMAALRAWGEAGPPATPEARAGRAEEALDIFLAAQAEAGLTLYDAQQEALLELAEDKHVILATPTGSGKSLVASFAHFLAMARGQRSYYTCPIKALVSEKFFALCREFGAEHVGMLTGDASINADAPIVCCTAEVLASLSLEEGADVRAQLVVMDEFHYYADAERGVAWQLPLLCMPACRFLLMSATLGDTSQIVTSLEQHSGVEVAQVSSMQRPVPLDYTYAETPVAETLAELLRVGRAPIYVVHFAQRDAIEAAQSAMSRDFLTRERKAEIAAAIGPFRFDTPFGKTMRRFLHHGIGVHHAGLLPKYRLLVEKLAQQGLLAIIMGTDTLGVGINVPIRTVLFTRLCKYDGRSTAILTVRDFKQIAGRAGRRGYDTEGSVVAQAPEHVIENLRAARKVEGDARALRKLVKKKPPQKGYVPWDKSTFERLVQDPPEPLVSRFVVDHHLMLQLLRRHSGGYRALIGIIARCHERPRQKTILRRRARGLFRALLGSGVVRLQRNRLHGARIVVDEALGADFSLTHALSLFLLDLLPEIDPASETHTLDVLSAVESILESPHAVIGRQVDIKRKERLEALRAEGVPYEERIAELDKIEHDKPLGDFIYAHFNDWAQRRPWARDANVFPKSIAREMVELSSTFVEYVGRYGLERQEGVLLRYLMQVYRALNKSLPAVQLTDGLVEVVAFLRDTLGRVDASLQDEWSTLRTGAQANATAALAARAAQPVSPWADRRLAPALIRQQMHQLVRLLAARAWADASAYLEASETGDAVTALATATWPPERLEQALAEYFAEYKTLLATPESRRPEWTLLRVLSDDEIEVQQTLMGPDEPSLWALHARAHLLPDGTLKLALERIGP